MCIDGVYIINFFNFVLFFVYFNNVCYYRKMFKFILSTIYLPNQTSLTSGKGTNLHGDISDKDDLIGLDDSVHVGVGTGSNALNEHPEGVTPGDRHRRHLSGQTGVEQHPSH